MMKFTTACGFLSVCLAVPFGLFAEDSLTPAAASKPADSKAAGSDAASKDAAPAEAATSKNTPQNDLPNETSGETKPVAEPVRQRTLGGLHWHIDYAPAYQQARQERKWLFLFFRDDRDPRTADGYERNVLSLPENQPWLKNVVRAVLPIHVQRPADAKQPKSGKLLDHGAFSYMYGRMGIVMIDLLDAKSPHYGQVVSAHPFTNGQHYTVKSTQVVLGLPRGSVTQRALVYAVRMHPQQPASAFGTAHPFLMEQARRSSQLMAQSESVGHHDWGTRSSEISAVTGRSPSEVAASGFGGGSLIDAAFECVNSWQGSPTHWGMMTAPSAIFGYDMVRSASGTWYGTGIFAN